MSDIYDSARHDRIIDEGVLIATSAVRMAAKNHLILRAVRDHVAFDRPEVLAFAVQQFDDLAAQEDASARREDRRLAEDPPARRRRRRRDRALPEISAGDVRRDLAGALRMAGADTARLEELIDRAREDALTEITTARNPFPQTSPRDPDYARDRAERMATLVAFDLSELAAEHGLSLDDLSD